MSLEVDELRDQTALEMRSLPCARELSSLAASEVRGGPRMWGERRWHLLQMGNLLPYGQCDDRTGSEAGCLPQEDRFEGAI